MKKLTIYFNASKANLRRSWRTVSNYQFIMDEKGCEAMIINSSTVAMSSERNYLSYSSTVSESLLVREDSDLAATISISKDSLNMMEQIKAAKQSMVEEEKSRRKANEQANIKGQLDMLKQMATDSAKKAEQVAVEEADSPTELKLELLKQILEMLKRGNERYGRRVNTKGLERHIEELESKKKSSSYASFQGVFAMSNVSGMSVSIGIQGGNASNASSNAGNGGAVSPAGRSNTWVRHTVTSSFVSEMENTAFSTTGIAKTADGREICFNVDIEMSRGFMMQNETYVKSLETKALVDPLVINVGSDVTRVSDQKFYFDLDADGNEEEISYLGKGSGFLALDKNNDGTINDGNELFGTRSGDGFKDLSAYDEDGNGWIDEADSIFHNLKIWTKNDDGTNELIAIGKAGIGAIYLGNADTEYSLKNLNDGSTNGVIRKTGVFLRETGEAGTIQHVDLAI